MGRTARAPEAPPSAPSHHDGPFGLSDTAVDRFREYVPEVRGLSWLAARGELRAIARSATKTSRRTPRGDEIWTTDQASIEFVVKSNDRGGMVATTVHRAGDAVREGWDEE